MLLTPAQCVYQVVCKTTCDVLYALDAASLDEAQERALHILETELSVLQSVQNVRILVLPLDDIADASIYYAHAYFLMQDLRRRNALTGPRCT
jgi:hypothetical protein